MGLKYIPPNVPKFDKLEDLIIWLDLEFRRLSNVINRNIDQPYDPVGVNFDKFVDGMIIYADGTNFDPGSGRGLYLRNNNAWEKL